jgi:GNAT superfamily N-acetyltransferase
MPEARELLADESHRAALALLELRPRFESVERITSQIDAQRSSGYRVVGSFEDGDQDAAAVAGFRIAHNLAWGRFAYVDDLVTRAALRGRGHADAVMAWVEREARRQGCGELHLDSGVGPDRADAHRFYFRHGMRIASYHFGRVLAVER